jgi:hypothetical protein
MLDRHNGERERWPRRCGSGNRCSRLVVSTFKVPRQAPVSLLLQVLKLFDRQAVPKLMTRVEPAGLGTCTAALQSSGVASSSIVCAWPGAKARIWNR